MLNHATFRQLLGELWAVLRHQDQAVTLVQHVFGVHVAVMGELPRCGGGAMAPFTAAFRSSL